jgi:flagellar FliL protein
MATAQATANDLGAAPRKKSKTLIVTAAAAALAAAAGGGGAFLLLAQRQPPAAAGAAAAPAEGLGSSDRKSPAQYLAMEPAFVVNLEDDEAMRYLQIDVEVMTRDPRALAEIKIHMPRIRNALLMLFTQQHYHGIVTREGKEALQAQALAEVQKVLSEETGKPGIDALYFTNFVMQ